jgi:hypothetical protein
MILLVMFVPIAIIVLCIERILIGLGQDPQVASYAFQYSRASLVGLLFAA